MKVILSKKDLKNIVNGKLTSSDLSLLFTMSVAVAVSNYKKEKNKKEILK